MNNFSPLLHKSLDELNIWLLQRPSLPLDDMRFYERIKNLLIEARDTEPSNVDSVVVTILYTLVDSGPDEVLREGFLPSFHQIASAIQKKKKKEEKNS